jgi:TolA-binding protein
VPDPEEAAGVLYTEAQALIKASQELEARAKLASIGEQYSQSRWFVPAMMVKIDIEDRRALREFDPVIGQVAPASVQTKRLLSERAPQHPTAEAALWQLGESYDGMKQYALAVQAYAQLGTRFPNTRLDAWFKAGEITERRLKNREDARAAYLRVPPSSARYRDAQDRARKLAGR